MKRLIFMTLIALLPTFGFSNDFSEDGSYLLKRVIGGETQNDPNSYLLSCSIGAHQLTDLKEVQALIKEASQKKTNVAYFVRAMSPSIYYEAMTTKGPLLLKKAHGSMETRDGKAAQTLMSRMDEICGKYDRGRSVNRNPQNKPPSPKPRR